MTTIRYSFRPSLFAAERTLVFDDQGITVVGADLDRRMLWADVDEVHIEPVAAGDDDKTRWLINLRISDGSLLRVDSVSVRGAADFEHKTKAFAEVLVAIHAALASRGKAVRYRFGARRGVLWAWRIALVLALATGLFGIVAAVIAEEYEAIIYGGVFTAFGLFGLLTLRGKGGPVAYDPADFAAAWKTSDAFERPTPADPRRGRADRSEGEPV